MYPNPNGVIVAQVYALAGLWIDTLTDAKRRGITETTRIGCQMVRGELAVLRAELEPDQPGHQQAADAIIRLHQMIAAIEDSL